MKYKIKMDVIVDAVSKEHALKLVKLEETDCQLLPTVENINNKVINELSAAVDDLFVKMQEDLNIKEGDISPTMSLKMDHALQDLEKVVTEILLSQL